jgi:hypothetical protein
MLTLHASSIGLDPTRLSPDKDLVLHIPPRHGSVLPAGALLEDHLTIDQRLALDRSAHAALAAWRTRFDQLFTLGPVSLTEVWHGELFCDVFLPTLRDVAGISAVVDRARPQAVRCHGLDPDLVSWISSRVPAVEAGPGPAVASQGGARQRPWQRAVRFVAERTGLPALARGDILVLSYATSQAVLERLLAQPGRRPVAYLGFPPPPALAARAAARGGWTGLPGARARAESARALAVCIERAIAMAAPDAPQGVGELLHRRAVRLLAERAGDTWAIGSGLDRALSAGRIRSVLVPFDYQPIASVLICTAQRRGIPVLSLQHGYQARPVLTPGWLAEHAGLWSPSDVDALPAHRRRGARAVGNPLRHARSTSLALPAARTRAIVLVQHPERTSAAIDRRINARQLEIAASALQRTRPDWELVVRPHPSDDVAEYRALAAQLDHAWVTVDATTPILELLASARLCIASASTVALQTVLTDTRVVVLNATSVPWAPPLDGLTRVPVVSDAAGLVVAIEDVLAAPEQPGADDLTRALGYDAEDPATEIIEWLEALGRSTK